LPSVHKASGSIPSTTQKEKIKRGIALSLNSSLHFSAWIYLSVN
jgi:hypothetical protein